MSVYKTISTLLETIRSKRVLKWEFGSFSLYMVPPLIRFVTKKAILPILNLPGYSIIPGLPPNLVETTVMYSIFPLGAGSVFGEEFFKNYGKELGKYAARALGALSHYIGWCTVELIVRHMHIVGPHGQLIGDPPSTFPYKLLLIALAIYVPDLVSKIYNTIKKRETP